MAASSSDPSPSTCAGPVLPRRVLVLCTGNSARSQIAEGLLRELGRGRVEAASAGSDPTGRVHPLAIEAMAERGIDIADHASEHLERYRSEPWDVVITVCDHAAEGCPVFPGPAERLHWGLPDPAAAEGSKDQRLDAFRRVRDDLEARIRGWLGG